MYQKILVPLDGSDLAECVLPHVASIAQGCGVKSVVFVRTVETSFKVTGAEGSLTEEQEQTILSQMRSEAEEYLKQIVERTSLPGVEVQTELLSGNAAEVIASYATDIEADLIIIATHGRSGISRWVWGSVADRILRSACVPVLMVRAPGCVI